MIISPFPANIVGKEDRTPLCLFLNLPSPSTPIHICHPHSYSSSHPINITHPHLYHPSPTHSGQRESKRTLEKSPTTPFPIFTSTVLESSTPPKEQSLVSKFLGSLNNQVFNYNCLLCSIVVIFSIKGKEFRPNKPRF